MAGNITWSENHQKSSSNNEGGSEEKREVLNVDLMAIDDIRIDIESIALEIDKYVKNKPSNEMYSASIHLEQFLRLLNN